MHPLYQTRRITSNYSINVPKCSVESKLKITVFVKFGLAYVFALFISLGKGHFFCLIVEYSLKDTS